MALFYVVVSTDTVSNRLIVESNQVARDVDCHLGGHANSGLYIDETAIPKKEKMSVGVNRQWCGQLAKNDNCQVGVFAVLGRDKYAAPID